jgi:diguanylate cyclase (GGDEF)-like protein
MDAGERGEELWPLVAELSAATARATGKMPVIRSTLRHLAILCEASVELWRAGEGDDPLDQGWHLLAGEMASGSGAVTASLTPPLDDTVLSAALCLQTIAVTEPLPALTLPLVACHRLQGVLLVRAQQAAAATLDWRNPLEAFTPVLGLFLHALDLDAALVSEPAFDRLAGVASAARLSDQLDRELARARRTRQSFTLLMVGLDRYDALGLELGAAQRDRIAQLLAVMLRDACRDSDVIGRYAPDRFLILLPDTNSQGAQIVASRQLEHLYRRPIILPGHEPFYLDVSIGIALFPVDGLTHAEMIESANNALVAARRLGGRRAVAA